MFKQKKSMFILIAAIALCAIMLCACGKSGADETIVDETVGKLITSGDWQYVKKSDGTISLLDYTGEDVDLVIPSEIDGMTVTSIGVDSYLAEDEDGSDAYFATNLTPLMTTITIPETVTEIEEGTFALCHATKSIIVAEANSEYCAVDGVLFTKDMKKIIAYPVSKEGDTYVIPDGVQEIGQSAFFDLVSLSSLRHIEIPDGVTRIGNWGLCGQFEEIVLPNSVMEIGIDAFGGTMESINIPASVQTIAHEAFNSCKQLKNINVSSLNENYCDIDGVLFTDDGTKLVAYPLGREETSYELPNGVKIIGEYAFFNNDNLESLTINAGLSSIEASAFYGCDALKDIYYRSGQAMWNKITIEAQNEVFYEAEIHLNYTGID